MTRLYTSIFVMLMASIAVAGEHYPKAANRAQGTPVDNIVDIQGRLDGALIGSNRQRPLKLSTAPNGGDVKSYVREAYTYYEMMGGVYSSYTDAFISNVVFDGNDVYIQNPVSELPTGGYIKGAIEGDKIKFEFPQSIGEYQGVEVFVNRFKLEWTDEANEKVMYFIAPEGENVLTMNLLADGTIEMDKATSFTETIDMPQYVLGLNDGDGAWAGYAEWDAVYTINPNVSEGRPDGVVFDQYQMRYNDMAGRYIDLGIDGDKVYLSGLSDYFPNSCVVGTVQGKKVSFESGQYLGVDEEWHQDCFFWTFYLEWGFDDYYGYEGWLIKLTEKLEMEYDPDNKTLVADQSFLFNLGNDELCYTTMFKQPRIEPKPEHFVAAAPENPRFDQVDEYNSDEYYNYARLAFSLPMFNVNGNLMDLDRVFYNVYFGDELYTFEPEFFIHLTEPMADVPYLFRDIPEYGGYEIKNTGDIDHYIYFDNQPDIQMSQVGLQLIYRDVDDVLYKSDLVYYKDSGVDDIISDKGGIKGVAYYDMFGREVKNPGTGAFVKVIIKDDGSRISEKVFLKK